MEMLQDEGDDPHVQACLKRLSRIAPGALIAVHREPSGEWIARVDRGAGSYASKIAMGRTKAGAMRSLADKLKKQSDAARRSP